MLRKRKQPGIKESMGKKEKVGKRSVNLERSKSGGRDHIEKKKGGEVNLSL